MKKNCPVCNSLDGVREYIYGLPSEEPDTSKYALGGCCISEDTADYKCIKCFTDFYKDSDRYHNRFISDGSEISVQCRECEQWIPVSAGLDAHECFCD